jgi:putative ABC transport system substrate-binding protein
LVIPIVLALSTDPIGSGFATSLAHPGGDITGLANSMDDSTPKQLELLSATVPNLSRLGLLANSSSPNFTSVAKNVAAATQTKGVNLVMADVRTAEEFDSGFALLLRENVQAVMLASNTMFYLNRQRIAEFMTKNHCRSASRAVALHQSPTREASERSALGCRALAGSVRPREGHPVEHPQTRKWL